MLLRFYKIIENVIEKKRWRRFPRPTPESAQDNQSYALGSALKRSASEPGVLTIPDYREVLLGLSRISKFAGLIIVPVWLFCCHCK